MTSPKHQRTIEKDRQSRWKKIENSSKMSNDRFVWNVKPPLDLIISGTICDKHKPISSAEREHQ